jgi:hypothetical protein
VPGTVEGPNDLYAFDGYPGGSCKVDSTPSSPGVAPDWGLYGPGGAKGGASASPNTPGFAAEFGGGWFDYWGSNGDYDCTAIHRGVGYQRVFYATNIANGITLQSFYMTYGGTSWGWLPAPVVFTSYDYGSAIDETRGLRDKARVMKQMGEFIAAVPDIRRMDKGEAVTPSNDKVRVYHNVNRRDGQPPLCRGPQSQQRHRRRGLHLQGEDPRRRVRGPLADQGPGQQDADGQLRPGRPAAGLFDVRDPDAPEVERRRPGPAVRPRRRGGRDGAALCLRAEGRGAGGRGRSAFDAAKGDLKLTYAHKGLARVRITGGGRPPLTLLLADAETGQTFWRRDALLVRGPGLVRATRSRAACSA